MPRDEGGEINAALRSTDGYEYADAYNETELAKAATMIVADLVPTAGFDAPSVY